MILSNPYFRYFLVLSVILLLFTSCGSKRILTDKGARNIPGNLRERYAVLLGVQEKDLKNEKLYRFIDEWIGTPHRAGGMDKKGVDCSGFASLLEQEVFNKTLPRTAKLMAEQVKRKYENELEEGDLVFFDFEGQKFSHVGIYLHNNKFVHASTSKGVVISNLRDPWYYKYFSRAGTVKL